jgi:anthranilate synthase component 1
MMTKRTDNIYLSLSGDRYTPFSLAKKLGAKAVLESASFSQGKDRYSILMLEEAFRVIQDEEGVAFVVEGKRQPFHLKEKADILDALLEIAEENELPPQNIPLPAAGIGYLSYEFCARCDTIHLAPQIDELHIPESEFIVGHVYIVFDHFTETLHVFALNYKEHEIDLDNAILRLKEKLNDLDFSYMANPHNSSNCRVLTDLKESKKEYLEKVCELQKHIVAGDIIQAVPSRRLQLESDVDALEVYRRLRSVNPSPYLFYLNYGTHQFIGASPESIVRVRDGVASIRPIAGTRRRGKNEEEDLALKKELINDPKERAEHLMLVDLAIRQISR